MINFNSVWRNASLEWLEISSRERSRVCSLQAALFIKHVMHYRKHGKMIPRKVQIAQFYKTLCSKALLLLATYSYGLMVILVSQIYKYSRAFCTVLRPSLLWSFTVYSQNIWSNIKSCFHLKLRASQRGRNVFFPAMRQ